MLGLLWSFYACYKLLNFNSKRPSKISNNKEDPEIVSKAEPEIFLRKQEVHNNINEEPSVKLKKEPKISKNQKWKSKI